MEARYLNRFRSIGEKTGSQIKNQDSAGNLTERLTHARGSISTQKQNIGDLFGTSIEMITGINTHQQMMGVELVKNIPLAGENIRKSPSDQLGYVQLTIRFLQSGLLHFMEEMYNAQVRISELEGTMTKLADFDSEVEIIGRLKELDIDTLESNTQSTRRPPTPPDSVTTPPPMNGNITNKIIKKEKDTRTEVSNPSSPTVKTPMKKTK